MLRRDLLKAGLITTTLATIVRPALGEVLPGGKLPWNAGMKELPKPIAGAPLTFFNEGQAKLVGSIFDRLIPADEISISATEAGCVVFTDAQLNGPFGKAESRYKLGPFKKGTIEQGPQSPITPAEYYQRGLSALSAHCSTAFSKDFPALSAEEQDGLLEKMESGDVAFTDTEIDAKVLFELLLQNAREGYFADPIYGGNKDMAGWKMIGFPGTVYDYRPYLAQTGQPMNIEPTSLISR